MTHAMMLLMLQVGVILFCAKLGNILFEKIKLPGVLGELVTGMIIGPYMLGSFSIPGFPHGLFPIEGAFPVSPELYGLCTIASIVLLFIVGLETDLRMFMKYSVAGSVVGINGVLFSFLLGDFSAVALSSLISSEPIGFFSPISLFLGVISTATSVGITARILSEKKKMDSPEGVTILAGAVIDDVLGIIFLAIVLGIISASKATGTIDWGHIGIIAGKTISIWLAATALGLVASNKLSTLLKQFKHKTSISIMALGLALIVSGIFEEAGLAMIIGAYVTGLSLSRTDISHVIQEKLHPVYELLVPVFFCVMGMLVNFQAMGSKNVIIFGLIYSLIAIIAKLVGCGISAGFFNFNFLGSLRIGMGMVPRGEVALIVAGIGLSAGIVGDEVFGISIIMTLISTIIAPPLLLMLFNINKRGTRSKVAEEASETIELEFPSPELTDMIKDKILLLFKSEGYFVHLIDSRDLIYQMRRESSIISFRRYSRKIIFECEASEKNFVYTALYEVMGELEQTLKGLQKPIDKKTLGMKIQKSRKNEKNTFKLSEYLKLDLISLNIKAENKEDLIEEMLNLLDKSAIKDMKEARKAVFAREESMSTGMQFGVAIPHARTNSVDKLICAIGIKKEGIDFEALDGKPSQIFVITLSPEGSSAPHIQFMSSITQVLSPSNIEKILNSRKKSEIYEIFTGEKIYRKNKKVIKKSNK